MFFRFCISTGEISGSWLFRIYHIYFLISNIHFFQKYSHLLLFKFYTSLQTVGLIFVCSHDLYIYKCKIFIIWIWVPWFNFQIRSYSSDTLQCHSTVSVVGNVIFLLNFVCASKCQDKFLSLHSLAWRCSVYFSGMSFNLH